MGDRHNRKLIVRNLLMEATAWWAGEGWVFGPAVGSEQSSGPLGKGADWWAGQGLAAGRRSVFLWHLLCLHGLPPLLCLASPSEAAPPSAGPARVVSATQLFHQANTCPLSRSPVPGLCPPRGLHSTCHRGLGSWPLTRQTLLCPCEDSPSAGSLVSKLCVHVAGKGIIPLLKLSKPKPIGMWK